MELLNLVEILGIRDRRIADSDISIFTSLEVIQVVRSHLSRTVSVLSTDRFSQVNRSYIWRWPLYLYGSLKSLFPGSPSTIRPDPQYSMTVGIVCTL